MKLVDFVDSNKTLWPPPTVPLAVQYLIAWQERSAHLLDRSRFDENTRRAQAVLWKREDLQEKICAEEETIERFKTTGGGVRLNVPPEVIEDCERRIAQLKKQLESV